MEPIGRDKSKIATVLKSGKGDIPKDHASQIESSRLAFIESVHQ